MKHLVQERQGRRKRNLLSMFLELGERADRSDEATGEVAPKGKQGGKRRRNFHGSKVKKAGAICDVECRQNPRSLGGGKPRLIDLSRDEQ